VRQFRRGGVTEAEIMLLCVTPYFPSTEPSTVNSAYIGFRRRGAPPPRNPAYAQDRCTRRPSWAIRFAGGAARPA